LRINLSPFTLYLWGIPFGWLSWASFSRFSSPPSIYTEPTPLFFFFFHPLLSPRLFDPPPRNRKTAMSPTSPPPPFFRSCFSLAGTPGHPHPSPSSRYPPVFHWTTRKFSWGCSSPFHFSNQVCWFVSVPFVWYAGPFEALFFFPRLRFWEYRWFFPPWSLSSGLHPLSQGMGCFLPTLSFGFSGQLAASFPPLFEPAFFSPRYFSPGLRLFEGRIKHRVTTHIFCPPPVFLVSFPPPYFPLPPFCLADISLDIYSPPL